MKGCLTTHRLGRKLVFRLAVLSTITGGTWSFLIITHSDVFPVRLILLSPLFSIFGGGVPVLGAVINSIIADVTTER